MFTCSTVLGQMMDKECHIRLSVAIDHKLIGHRAHVLMCLVKGSPKRARGRGRGRCKWERSIVVGKGHGFSFNSNPLFCLRAMECHLLPLSFFLPSFILLFFIEVNSSLLESSSSSELGKFFLQRNYKKCVYLMQRAFTFSVCLCLPHFLPPTCDSVSLENELAPNILGRKKSNESPTRTESITLTISPVIFAREKNSLMPRVLLLLYFQL